MGTKAAVVDTGFWGTCCALGLARYLTQVWAPPIWMPGAVLAELFAQPQPATAPSWAGLYPDQHEFLQHFRQGVLRPTNPRQSATTQFNAGERAVIDLALELRATALIDEQRAHLYALQQGLDAVSVPEYLVLLLQEGILTVTDAEHVFRQLVYRNRSPKPFVDWARQVIRAQGGQV